MRQELSDSHGARRGMMTKLDCLVQCQGQKKYSLTDHMEFLKLTLKRIYIIYVTEETSPRLSGKFLSLRGQIPQREKKNPSEGCLHCIWRQYGFVNVRTHGGSRVHPQPPWPPLGFVDILQPKKKPWEIPPPEITSKNVWFRREKCGAFWDPEWHY